jgi:hypothetical protein
LLEQIGDGDPEMKSEERAALLDLLIFFDLHSNNHTLAKVLEQLDDITSTLSTL